MDHEALAEQFVGWARKQFGTFRHQDDTIWLGTDELSQEQVANVVEQWTELGVVSISRADAYAIAFYATNRLKKEERLTGRRVVG